MCLCNERHLVLSRFNVNTTKYARRAMAHPSICHNKRLNNNNMKSFILWIHTTSLNSANLLPHHFLVDYIVLLNAWRFPDLLVEISVILCEVNPPNYSCQLGHFLQVININQMEQKPIDYLVCKTEICCLWRKINQYSCLYFVVTKWNVAINIWGATAIAS